MENSIFKAYEKLDDSIMYVANKGVKAWNWTTGQIKADLANQMLTIAPILEITGAFMDSLFWGVVYFPTFLGLSHVNQQHNKKIEAREKKAREKGLKLLPKEYDIYSFSAPGFGLLGGSRICNSQNELGDLVTGLGLSISSASQYVMRADYVEPGKSVFERAKDKLVEKLKASTPVPVAQPSLVPVPIKYSPNFNDFIEQ